MWCPAIFHAGLYILGPAHIPAAFLSHMEEKQVSLDAT